MCLFCFCVVLCLGRGPVTSWSPVQGVLPSEKWSWNWEMSPVLQSESKRSDKKSYIWKSEHWNRDNETTHGWTELHAFLSVKSCKWIWNSNLSLRREFGLRFEVKILCSFGDGCKRWGGNYSFYVSWRLPEIKSTVYSITLVTIYETTRCQRPENHSLSVHVFNVNMNVFKYSIKYFWGCIIK
jgi:hypothetical protein